MADFSYDGDDLEVLSELPNYQQWILDSFRPHLRGCCWEIGAGLGAISALLLPHVERLHLVEPAPNLHRALQRRFADQPRVTLHAGDAASFLADAAVPRPDCVVMVNVLEHIEDDAATLRAIRQRLPAGGQLLLFVPALPFLFSRLDRELGHFRRYTRHNLRRLAEEAGFTIERLDYFDLLGILPWWLVNTLAGSTRFDPRATRLYDRVGVPLTRSLEGLVSPPLGKNLLACLTRT
ncbi:MAG: class I SAM-dependent methyltransferase [Magnetococcales bacterium]|nr:class I SAM-dependent methyltransferase [Magnetococcales bacterium]